MRDQLSGKRVRRAQHSFARLQCYAARTSCLFFGTVRSGKGKRIADGGEQLNVLTIDGLQEKVQKLVQYMGGSFQRNELTEATSHLVTSTVMSQKYEVSIEW